MINDAELLRQYAVSGTETAFAELVRRHVNLIYRAALRQLDGDAHRAAEVAQIVFTLLARKAATVARHPTPAGWLYTTTYFTVQRLRREDRRRRFREREAYLMHNVSGSEEYAADWDRLRPALDQAMQDLNERDRDALIARFFLGSSFNEIVRNWHYRRTLPGCAWNGRSRNYVRCWSGEG